MSNTAADDPTVSALLAMAEYFTTQQPVLVGEAVRCLLAVLALRPAARIEAPMRLRLGLLLCCHGNCPAEAREHLEKAMLVAQTAANLEGVRFHAASALAALLAGQGLQHQAKSLLRGKLEATPHHAYWHIRLMLQLADLHSNDQDVAGVSAVLGRCADYCQEVGAGHTHLLCLLANGALLLTHHNYTEAGTVLNVASSRLEAYQGPQLTLLRTFYLTIQVTHLLMAGQVKTAKLHLKQLQQCVQSLSSEPEDSSSSSSQLTPDSFRWLTRSQAYITVYLVSVLHSVQSGFTEKALSYADKAMQFISQEQRGGGGGLVVPVLQAHILEQCVQCLLMQGHSSAAADKLQEVVNVCHSHPRLIYSHRAVLHTLLGLYAFSNDNLDKAISQFQTALQHTNSRELRVLVSLNLAISYMKVGGAKEQELSSLISTLDSEGGNMTCQSLKSALFYVRGLYSFCCGRLHEAKRHLRETLLIANSSDLNKLTSCSLLLLGQIFLALGNTKETLDMVSPALQLSVKMPDNRLQVWAASLLADLYHTVGEVEKEQSLRLQSRAVQSQLMQEQQKACEGSSHGLVQWTFGDWPITTPAHQTTLPPLPTPSQAEPPEASGNGLLPVKEALSKPPSPSPHHHTPPSSLPAPPHTPPHTSSLNPTTDNPPHAPDTPPASLSHNTPPRLTPHPLTPPPLTPAPHTRTRNNSVTLNGSPVPLKTPEIHLKRMESSGRPTTPKHPLDSPKLEPAAAVKQGSVANWAPFNSSSFSSSSHHLTYSSQHSITPVRPPSRPTLSSTILPSHQSPSLPEESRPITTNSQPHSLTPSLSHHPSTHPPPSHKYSLPSYTAHTSPPFSPGQLQRPPSLPPYEQPPAPPKQSGYSSLSHHPSPQRSPYYDPPHPSSPHKHQLSSHLSSLPPSYDSSLPPGSPLSLPSHPTSLQHSPRTSPYLSPPSSSSAILSNPPSSSPAVAPTSPKLHHLSSHITSPQPHRSPQPHLSQSHHTQLHSSQLHPSQQLHSSPLHSSPLHASHLHASHLHPSQVYSSQSHPSQSHLYQNSPHRVSAAESAVNQHMLQTQQQLLWQQTMLQRRALHSGQAVPLVYPQAMLAQPAQYGVSPAGMSGVSPTGVSGVHLLPSPPQLRHMTTLQVASQGQQPSPGTPQLLGQALPIMQAYSGTVATPPAGQGGHLRQYGTQPRR